MSKCHKCAKWFPHNWLCLRGLSYVFIALFYLIIVSAFVQIVVALVQIGWAMAWRGIMQLLLQQVLPLSLLCLTFAKVLAALRAIKHAVAPCCCEGKKEETK